MDLGTVNFDDLFDFSPEPAGDNRNDFDIRERDAVQFLNQQNLARSHQTVVNNVNNTVRTITANTMSSQHQQQQQQQQQVKNICICKGFVGQDPCIHFNNDVDKKR